MKITNPNHVFEEPTQVAFTDPHDGITVLPWISLVDEIIGY